MWWKSRREKELEKEVEFLKNQNSRLQERLPYQIREKQLEALKKELQDLNTRYLLDIEAPELQYKRNRIPDEYRVMEKCIRAKYSHDVNKMLNDEFGN